MTKIKATPSDAYLAQRLEIIKLLLPVVTQNTDIEFVQKVLKLGVATYDPVKHWPQYVATRAVQMADAILQANGTR